MSKQFSNPNLLSPQVRQVLSNLSQKLFYHESDEYNHLQDVHPG